MIGALRKGLIASVLLASTAHAAEVKFSELFRSGTLGGSTVVQVPPGDVLIFDGGEHILDGRDLVVLAERAIVRSPTTVRSYRPDNAAPSASGAPPSPPQAQGQLPCSGRNGCPGITGVPGVPGDDAAGVKGRPSGRLVLEIDALKGAAGTNLLIIANGQKGGRGQQGSPGGQGARGGTGADATGIPSCKTPGRGGTGGQGGSPGRGGRGGIGGDGGVVLASAPIMELLRTGSTIKVDDTGGLGGDAGPAGLPGVGGQGGSRGAGSKSCSQNPPGPADDGPPGPSTPPANQVTPPAAVGASGSIAKLPDS